MVSHLLAGATAGRRGGRDNRTIVHETAMPRMATNRDFTAIA